MNLVTIENLTHYYSERVLFQDASLLINEGDRIGLIGPNGSGKSTLLRIVAGEETAVSGSVTVWGGVRIHYLSQNPPVDPGLTVRQTVFQSDAPNIRLLRRYEDTSRALQQTPHDTALQQRLAQLTQEMDRTGGWAAEAEAETILTKLGVTEFDARLGVLSGGQQKRVALARALLDPADLLILDEPTNHIDAEAIDWLEAYLLRVPRALLMVTHDRYFLDRVVNRIVELDRQELVAYPGNYGRYLELRTTRHERLAAAEEKRQAMLRRELEWLRRGAQARSTKQKARKQRIAEMQQIAYNRGDQRIAMALASRRLGKRVLEATNLSKSYDGQTLFSGVDFMLHPGDRVGVIGPNGAGKTTFLDVLAGRTTPDSGRIKWGDTVHLGYYDQHSSGLRDEMTVLQFLETAAPLIRTDEGERVDAAKMLEWFLFPRPQQQAKVGSLSGGERRRLYLLYTLTQQPNVLFLDEPTNDLDIQTLNVLEQFLDAFEGCLVVVSHDRYFLDRNVDFLVSFEEGIAGTRFPTPFAAYRELREAQQMKGAAEGDAPRKEVASRPTAAATAERPRKLTWQERQELAAVEAQIPQLEEKIRELETAVNHAGSDYVRLQELADALAAARAALETAETRWLQLSEIEDAG